MSGSDDDFAASIGATAADDDFAASIGARPADVEPAKGSSMVDAAKAFGQSAVGAGVRSAIQVPTAGFADELTAALGGLFDSGQAALGQRGDIDYDDAYRTRLDSIRNADKAAKEAHPVASGVGTVAGAAMAALAPGLRALGPAAEMSTGARMATAGGIGGANALGNSERRAISHDDDGFHVDTDELAGLGKEVGFGVGAGALAQGAMDKAAPYVGRALQPIADKVDGAATWVGDKFRGAGDAFKSAGGKLQSLGREAEAPVERLREDLSNWDAVASQAASGSTPHRGVTDQVSDWAKKQLTPQKLVRAVATGGTSLGRDAVKDVTKGVALKYGPGMAGKGLDQIGDVLQATPEVFGKFASTLQQAAQRGNHALAVTHFLLLQQDPAYREQIGVGED